MLDWWFVPLAFAGAFLALVGLVVAAVLGLTMWQAGRD